MALDKESLDKIRESIREELNESKSKAFDWITKVLIPVLIGLLTLMVSYQANRLVEAQNELTSSQNSLNHDQEIRLKKEFIAQEERVKKEFEYERELKYLDLFYNDIKSPSTQQNAIELLNLMHPDLALKLINSNWKGLSKESLVRIAIKKREIERSYDSLKTLENTMSTEFEETIRTLLEKVKSDSLKIIALKKERSFDESDEIDLTKYVSLDSLNKIQSDLNQANQFIEGVHLGNIELEKYKSKLEYEALQETLSQRISCFRVVNSDQAESNKIKGVVKDEVGRPLSKIKLTFSGGVKQETETDRNGLFEVSYTNKSGGIPVRMDLKNFRYEHCTGATVIIGSYLEITLNTLISKN